MVERGGAFTRPEEKTSKRKPQREANLRHEGTKGAKKGEKKVTLIKLLRLPPFNPRSQAPKKKKTKKGRTSEGEFCDHFAVEERGAKLEK